MDKKPQSQITYAGQVIWYPSKNRVTLDLPGNDRFVDKSSLLTMRAYDLNRRNFKFNDWDNVGLLNKAVMDANF